MDTKTREARVSKVPTATKPPLMLYCIRHERMVKAEAGEACGLGHVQIEGQGEDQEFDFCCFPLGWTTCPPTMPATDEWTPDQPDEEDVKAEVELGYWVEVWQS